jgi:hypothetical protein
MMNAFKSKAKRCCTKEYERLTHRLVSCEINSNSPEARHACYRRAAKISGRHAKACMAAG